MGARQHRRADERQAEGQVCAHRSPRRLGRLLRTTALVLLVLCGLAVPLTWAWAASLRVPTFPLDGAFQTMSGLLRLSEGQWPGRDFFPYLGAGPLLLLYPAFAARGADLTASVSAAVFVTLLALQLVFVVVTALVYGRRSPWLLAVAAAVPVLLVHLAGNWSGRLVVDSFCGGCLGIVELAATPGNSLRPLRAVAPYMLAMGAFYVLSRQWRPVTQMAVIGGASGVVAALWSNDYGLVSGALMVALMTGLVVLTRTDDRVRAAAAVWLSAGAAFLVAGLTATAGHFLPYLRYNLVDVRQDQFWYFASWSEDSRVFSPGDLLNTMRDEQAVFALAVLAAVIVHAYRRRDVRWFLLAYLGTALVAGGSAATIGGHIAGYFWSFRLWGYVVILVAGVRAVSWLAARAAARSDWAVVRRLPAGIGVVIGAITTAAMLLVATSAVSAAREARSALASDPALVFHPELGGYLDARFVGHLEIVEEHGPDVVEEYMGLAGMVTGPRTDLAVDAVIHALGDEREKFAALMSEPHDAVVSTAPGLSGWMSWNLSANWWFYRELFMSYEPVQTSPDSLLWTPTRPASWTPVGCSVSESGVLLEAAESGFYEVTLRYTGPGENARAFTMVQNNINFAAGAEGYVALDPGAEVQRFPVHAGAGSASEALALKHVPAGGEEPLTVLEGCSAARITAPEGANTIEIFTTLVDG